MQKLLDFARHDLENNLMKWWLEHSVDEKNGGYYGAVKHDNTPVEDADRFIVVNARLVWTFTAVYAQTKKETYKTQAKRAYDYLMQHFYDKEMGGFYTYVDYLGAVKNERKFVYGNVFAIYALAEYARVFEYPAAKKLALETVDLLDTHLWDAVYKGYFEVAGRDWQYLPNVLMIQHDAETQKTMNTHLHILEAYTNLLRIDGENKKLRHRVRTMLYLFLNKITNRESWHFNYFQRRDWTVTNPSVSIGHDIEGSWLLYETAEVLNEPEALADTRRVSINIARAVYDIAYAPNGGIYTVYDPIKNEYNNEYTPNFSWWEQAEGVVGFYNAYQLTNEKKFLDASLTSLEYIEKYFIDKQYGGWYHFVRPDGTPAPDTFKASPFTCPYHNVRMNLEILRRVK